MELSNYKKCDKCGELYDVSPFACMLGNGERADSKLEIYEYKYDLCPKCTYKIWEFVTQNRK